MKKHYFLLFLIMILSLKVMSQSASTKQKSYIIRLKPGDDLKAELDNFVNANKITAAAIVSCAGSLTQSTIRYANQKEGSVKKGYFEIVSLSGMLGINGGHVHISLANEQGLAFGGHLLAGCKIYTTAEIAIQVYEDLVFKRETDETYGYKELVVYPAKE